MDFLVLSPPVCPPSEPPSGAFILASALSGHGYDTGFFDLSLEFYHRHLQRHASSPGLGRALDYLRNNPVYDPMNHRTAAGAIHRALKLYAREQPGWTLTAMDLLPPVPVHQPQKLMAMLDHDDPFLEMWHDIIPQMMDDRRPERVLVSVAYLSQLTAAISLVRYLTRHGIPHTVGGSLIRSLHATGEGLHLLRSVIPRMDISNGASLIAGQTDRDFLSRLAYPQILCEHSYLSGRPILPLTLSTGCYWSGCRFCPDKGMKYIQIRMPAFDQFMASIPADVMAQAPVIHLLDSAMPKNRLQEFMPIAHSHGIQFYGFARPEKRFADGGFLRDLSQSGCLMLQLGVESGNDALLSRFNKGIHPDDARRVLNGAANAGIRTYVYLLFGLPGETDRAREDTRILISDAINSVDFLNLSIFNLPKYCELNDQASEFDIEIDAYAESSQAIELYRPFRVRGTHESPRKAARAFIANRFSSDEQIRLAILRTPKWFRAAHLALMKVPRRNSYRVDIP